MSIVSTSAMQHILVTARAGQNNLQQHSNFSIVVLIHLFSCSKNFQLELLKDRSETELSEIVQYVQCTQNNRCYAVTCVCVCVCVCTRAHACVGDCEVRRVSGAEQEYSLSKDEVNHDRAWMDG